MIVLLYIAAVAAANIVTAATAPLELGPFLVPWGTFAAAVTFVLRDLIQWHYGRAAAYTAILIGCAVAAVTSALLGDTLAVVVASLLAFGVGETLDTEVFTRLRARVPERIAVSGVVGGTVDSAIFVVVGLSPLWSGILPWSAVPEAIVGVALVKAALQLLGAAAWWAVRGHTRVVANPA